MKTLATQLKAEDTLLALSQVLPRPLLDLFVSETKEEFDQAFAAVVLSAVEQIEQDSKNLGDLNEDALSGEIARTINGTLVLQVTREKWSNGHVDLTFHTPQCKTPRRVLGESKIFAYYNWHVEGLKQILDRYTTGREERSLLLEFVKKKGIKEHMAGLRSELDKKLPCEQTAPCADHPVRWSFVTSHGHHTGEVLEVWHLGCNLYHPSEKSEAQTTPATAEVDNTA